MAMSVLARDGRGEAVMSVSVNAAANVAWESLECISVLKDRLFRTEVMKYWHLCRDCPHRLN